MLSRYQCKWDQLKSWISQVFVRHGTSESDNRGFDLQSAGTKTDSNRTNTSEISPART